jgi:hypothetical protein
MTDLEKKKDFEDIMQEQHDKWLEKQQLEESEDRFLRQTLIRDNERLT